MSRERMSNLEEPAWFGVTIGAQPYLVRAANSGEAVELVVDLFAIQGATGDGVDFVRDFAKVTVCRHEDEFQTGIDEKYPDETVVRVKPFTIERW